MKKTLLILTGKHKGKTLSLTNPVVVIGRDPKADIRVNSTEVSRLHCELHLRDEKLFIRDLTSRNGTFVDGEIIFAETELLPGHTLHVGTMVFELLGKKPGNNTAATRQPKPPATRVSKPASDDDVIDWLAEEHVFTDSDTTIVSNNDAENLNREDSSNLMPSVKEIQIQPVAPGTQAAEAAEIIRRYWQQK